MNLLVFGLLFAMGVTLLIVTAARVLLAGMAAPSERPAATPERPPVSALRILDERYATGELSTEEYQRRLRVLEGSD